MVFFELKPNEELLEKQLSEGSFQAKKISLLSPLPISSQFHNSSKFNIDPIFQLQSDIFIWMFATQRSDKLTLPFRKSDQVPKALASLRQQIKNKNLVGIEGMKTVASNNGFDNISIPIVHTESEFIHALMQAIDEGNSPLILSNKSRLKSLYKDTN